MLLYGGCSEAEQTEERACVGLRAWRSGSDVQLAFLLYPPNQFNQSPSSSFKLAICCFGVCYVYAGLTWPIRVLWTVLLRSDLVL